MDYKLKYLKYKNKYFELKNNLYFKNEKILYYDKSENKYINGTIININKEDINQFFYEIKLDNDNIRNTIINRIKKIP